MEDFAAVEPGDQGLAALVIGEPFVELLANGARQAADLAFAGGEGAAVVLVVEFMRPILRNTHRSA